MLSEVEKQGVAKAQIQILAALTRLRQVACDPRLIKLPGEGSDDTSGKLEALKEILSEAVSGGHRLLIFSQFVEMLKLIRNVLEEEDIAYEYLDGSTKDRLARVDRFNKDTSIPAFLISLKAGGTGLNLTGADTVVHFDPWWNPARRRPSDRSRSSHRPNQGRQRLPLCLRAARSRRRSCSCRRRSDSSSPTCSALRAARSRGSQELT